MDSKLANRLEHSEVVFQRVNAAWIIHKAMLYWYNDFKIHRLGLHHQAVGLRTMILATKGRQLRQKGKN
jgi:hypothetical protein